MAGLIGKEIGKYRITERIGRGGMAEVYLGVHTHLDRQVAIKVLHGYLLEGGDFIERFKREAKAVASLRHPNIVQVYDFDIRDEIIFMVMEYIQGTNLQQRLVELDKQGVRLPIKQTGSIINDIAGALDYAHSQGMLHRDVKPSNILIDKDGKAYLTDFGIARILGDHKLTATGTLVGTPAYMSPEQGKGEELTEESDIYSLGIVAFEMLTGRIPFDAKTPIGIVQKQIFDPVPDITKLVEGVPVTAQGVIDRALAKTPEGRYASAEELVGALRVALQALESAEPITVIPTSANADEEKLSAPTVAMEEAPASGEFEKPTVLMGEDQEPAQQEAASAPESEPQETLAPTGETRRKIPLWGLITGGVAVLAIAAVVLTQVADLSLPGSEPEPIQGEATQSPAPPTAVVEEVFVQPTVGPDTVIVQPGNAIEIGVQGPISGSLASYYTHIENVVTLAVAEYGFELGESRITLVPIDDRCEASAAASASRLQLSNHPDMLGIIGPFCSGAAVEALPVYLPAKLVSISGSATKDELANKFGSGGFFNRTVLSESQMSDLGVNESFIMELNSVQDFYSRYESQYGAIPTEIQPVIVYTYDAAQVLLHAIETTGSVGEDGSIFIERNMLANAVRSMHFFKGLTGPIRFEDDGDRNPIDLGG